jgi:putative ABC transport system substrate-binding protein
LFAATWKSSSRTVCPGRPRPSAPPKPCRSSWRAPATPPQRGWSQTSRGRKGNVTGSTFFAPEVGAKRLDLLKEALPGLRRAAYLSVEGNPITARLRPPLETSAKALQVELVALSVRDAQEVAAAFSQAAAQGVDAVVVPEYSLLRATAPAVARLAEKHRLPSIGFAEFAAAGGLVGYGPDDAALYRRAAVFIDKLLKGAKPGNCRSSAPRPSNSSSIAALRSASASSCRRHSSSAPTA